MRIAAAFLVVFALGTISSAARASDADFTLKNRTGYQIDSVYVSQHSSDHWGRDIIGRDTLDDGDAVDISFPHGGQACHFDIKVKYHDDTTAEWNNVDLCEYETISLFWDAKEQSTRAVGE